MNIFWEEFEKKAISGKLVDKALMSGLLRRSGVPASSAQYKDLMARAADVPPGSWKKLTSGWTSSSKGYLKDQLKRTKGTKQDPAKAAKELFAEIQSLDK